MLDLQTNAEVREITEQTETLLARGMNCVVKSDGDFEVAALDLQHVKGVLKRMTDTRMSFTRPLDASKKAIMDFFRGPEDKLARAENGIKRAMTGYQQEQERLRQEDQRRADEAARREREKLIARANKASDAGKIDKALELEDRASTVVAPVISREPPKVSGVSMRDVWKFEVVDEQEVPRQYLSVDEGKIRKVVGALRADCKIPGVRIWCEKQVAAASA